MTVKIKDLKATDYSPKYLKPDVVDTWYLKLWHQYQVRRIKGFENYSLRTVIKFFGCIVTKCCSLSAVSKNYILNRIL